MHLNSMCTLAKHEEKFPKNSREQRIVGKIPSGGIRDGIRPFDFSDASLNSEIRENATGISAKLMCFEFRYLDVGFKKKCGYVDTSGCYERGCTRSSNLSIYPSAV